MQGHWRGSLSESRVVAVLFTDVVGSLELKSRLGDTAVDELRRDHFRSLRDAVTEFGGHEVKSLGDGLMVVFDSPTQAVACALAMQRLVPRDGELAARFGVHLGETTIETDDYYGSAVDVAKRLCDAAADGTVAVSDVVRTVTSPRGRFAFLPLGPLEIKGVAEPMVAWEARGQAPAQAPMPAALQRSWWGTFVGRDAEREVLEGVWASARGGERRVVLVAGEPGIGKTRLAAEVAAVAHGDGATVLFGRCDEGLSAPYQPFVEALGYYVANASADAVRDAAARASEIARIVPEIVQRAPGIAVPQWEGDELKLFRAADALLASAAPVLLVLDDLHWADRSTLTLLRYLARSPDAMRLCVVGTYRETELDREHPLADVLADLRRERLVERVVLRGLDLGTVAALIADRAGHGGDEEFVGAVYAETQGNPFFTEEVVRHLAETGAAVERDGRWVTDRPVEELGIPEGVREVIGRRLARLSEDANRALHVAAVVGADFETSIVEGAGGPSGDRLLDALDEAERAGLISQAARVGAYTFAHALVRQTLYEELNATRRVQLHRRVGEAIEEAGNVEARLAELARHFFEGLLAGDATKAIDYCLRAGDEALGHMAHAEAFTHYQRVLAAIGESGAPADEARFRALVGTAACHGHASRLGPMTRGFDEAATLARAQHRRDWLAYVVIARSRFVSPGVANPQLESLLEEALASADLVDDVTRGRLYAMAAMTRQYSGHGGDVSALLAQARELLRDDPDPDSAVTLGMGEMYALIGTADVAGLVAAVRRYSDVAYRFMPRVFVPVALLLSGAAALQAGDLAASDRSIEDTRRFLGQYPDATAAWRAQRSFEPAACSRRRTSFARRPCRRRCASGPPSARAWSAGTCRPNTS